jgi:hypothetical protein
MRRREFEQAIVLACAEANLDEVAPLATTAYRAALVERMANDVEHFGALNRKLDYYEGVLAARDAAPEDVTGERSVRR